MFRCGANDLADDTLIAKILPKWTRFSEFDVVS